MILTTFSTPYATVGKGLGQQISSHNCLDSNKPIRKFFGQFLPHWQQENCLIYITLRLKDSLPTEKLETLEALRKDILSRMFDIDYSEASGLLDINYIHQIDKWLAQGYGECLLMDDVIREIVVNALEYYDGKRYEMYEYAVMPNHMHVLLIPHHNESIISIIEDFKRFTTREINKYIGRKGGIWQTEMFDHLIRSVGEYIETAEYIRNNPNPQK